MTRYLIDNKLQSCCMSSGWPLKHLSLIECTGLFVAHGWSWCHLWVLVLGVKHGNDALQLANCFEWLDKCDTSSPPFSSSQVPSARLLRQFMVPTFTFMWWCEAKYMYWTVCMTWCVFSTFSKRVYSFMQLSADKLRSTDRVSMLHGSQHVLHGIQHFSKQSRSQFTGELWPQQHLYFKEVATVCSHANDLHIEAELDSFQHFKAVADMWTQLHHRYCIHHVYFPMDLTQSWPSLLPQNKWQVSINSKPSVISTCLHAGTVFNTPPIKDWYSQVLPCLWCSPEDFMNASGTANCINIQAE